MNTNDQAAARRILLVDDNIDAASTTAALLEILGNEVRVVHDGLSAVAAAQEMRPDIILLDIGLPDIDGYEAARRIRAQEENRRARLVALTGWGQDQQQAEGAGFDEHWVKPISLDQLMAMLERAKP